MGNLQCINTCTSVIFLCKRENKIKKGGKDEFSLLNTFYDNKGSFSRKGKSKPAFKKKKKRIPLCLELYQPSIYIHFYL